jgi:hypothetical protein
MSIIEVVEFRDVMMYFFPRLRFTCGLQTSVLIGCDAMKYPILPDYMESQLKKQLSNTI